MGEAKRGEGVHQSYREEAKVGCDVLFHVKIKGRSTLVDGIPLHMSIKIFKGPSEYKLKELEEFVEKNHVVSPDPAKLTFEPIIFTAEKTGLEYYMLKVDGLGPQYKALYDEYDDVGNVYKKFFTHITIDKEIYDDAKKSGLKPEDIEFSKLTIEHGAGNTIHEFAKSENLEKGPIKHAIAGLAIAGGMAGSPAGEASTPHQHSQTQHVAKPAQANVPKPKTTYSSARMLNTIAAVETNHGKFLEHKPLGGIHSGERAIGKYGLTPVTIRETIHLNPDLKQKHAQAANLRGDDMRRYVEDNPGLEDTIAQKHLQRLEHHFGQDPEKIGYAWLEGIRGTYKAGKEGKDIKNHWHVAKIRDAYNREK